MVAALCRGTCAQVEALLAAQLDGPLSRADADGLAVHLRRCPECCALANGLEPAPVFPAIAPDVYELGPIIGIGGMGRVRIARDRRIGREVAIKELLYTTETLVARFVREARVAASLQHPNIVPIYEVGCWDDGTPFYAMARVRGRSLFDAISAASSPEERAALVTAVIAAADGTAFAHAHGVLHRDLTPSNILVGDFGETVIIDWGLAKALRAPAVGVEYRTGVTHDMLTAAGDVLGSPAYMPPEQAHGESTDERADVYALGAILYHVLAGSAPYVGRSAKAILAAVCEQAPPPLTKLAPWVTRALAELVDTATAREPSERYASAIELARDLRRFHAGLLAPRRPSLLRRWLRGRA